MEIIFHVDYRTKWGEALYFVSNLPGSDVPLRMNIIGSEHWTLPVNVPARTKNVEYRYIVRREDGSERHEWMPCHTLALPSKDIDLMVFDRWGDMPGDKPFYSSAIVDCICRRPNRANAIKPAAGNIHLCVDAPLVLPGQQLAVCGASDMLGTWNPAKALRMNDADFPRWTVNIPLGSVSPATEYKFVIIDSTTGAIVSWEAGANRSFGDVAEASGCVVVSGLRFAYNPAPWHGAGTAIPVFSIRTDQDAGSGDFAGIKAMTDWCAATGQRVLQLLPVNDTTMTHTWTDSYPYNANSTFALHPLYLSIREMGGLKDAGRQSHYDALAAELNALPEVDYEKVTSLKLSFAREMFVQEGKAVLRSKAFKDFVKRNEGWLPAYAAFCVLRDRNATPDFTKWGEYALYDKDKIGRFIDGNREETDFVCYLQYYLDKQMHEAKDYANSKGVTIKGDIPIGISRTSVDAWLDPRLFNLDCQAGAPPDDFSVLGQNWGFPTYNWEEMARDGFAWWKARFRKMSEYFDAYRIDHVLGFFRIWQIPMDALHGLLGVFNPALPFTPEELRYEYDFHFDAASMTRPLIMDWFLGDYFGEHTDLARQRFLEAAGNGCYALRKGFETQREVAAHFAKEEKTGVNDVLCEGLMSLIDNVLFIEDPYQKGKYHPRIAASTSYAYKSMDDHQRRCFDRLYNDFFYHRHNDFWYGKAMSKLPPLTDATDMLVCAEDLGMIPACVPAVMHRLEILSLEIQRMPKDPAVEFGDTWHYPYFSVCTTSTHDMGGFRQWWEEDHAMSQRFYNSVLRQGGEAPYYAEPWICEKVIDLHLKSPSMLCILPLQDWLSTDGELRRRDPREEQINVPSNPRHYWRYRMHLTVGELLGADAFNDRIRAMIASSGR